jgi:hypothetical protein
MKPNQLIIPKRLSPQEQREVMRQEYKRLSKNLEMVEYNKLDDESKYNYLICSLRITRPTNKATVGQDDESH